MDNDCDVTVDEGVTLTYYQDSDSDGQGNVSVTTGGAGICTAPSGYTGNATDCLDTDNTVYSGATEICDGLDNDCNTVLPGNEVDNDSDTYVECTIDVGGWDGSGSVIG